jgi:BNR repeat-like domain
MRIRSLASFYSVFHYPNKIILAIVSGIALAAQLYGQSIPTLPKAPGAEVFSLTQEPGSFTEPSIAINPTNPQQIVAVFQDNVHASYSRDAGRSWKSAEGVAPANYKVSGDVSTTFDKLGHAFVCYIAFDKLGTFNYWGHGATRNGIFVRRSLDGGSTWEGNDVPVAEQSTKPGIPFEDKPYIVADNSNSRFAGNLYVGWTRWTLTDSEILFSRSTDHGHTWSPAIEIDRHPGLPRDDNGANEGFDGVVGPDGHVYAVWSQDNYIFLAVSRDGGKTFSRARPIVHTAPIMFTIEALERTNGFPQIAIDPRTQRLFLTWSDYRNGDIDIFCSTSTDHGKKWSDPIRVNNDPMHDGADQFFQWLAVDPVEGSANVVFYDRREDPTNRKQTVTLARSTDQGHSFQNYAWTTNPFDADRVFFGDYTGMAASGGRVYAVWMEKASSPAEGEGKTGEAKPGDSGLDNPGQKTKPQAKGTIVKVGIADFQEEVSGVHP